MKRTLTYKTILALAMTLIGGLPVLGQHEGHQMPASPAVTPPVGAQALAGCSESAQSALQTLDSLRARLEQARQTNSGAELRNAVDSVQAALDGARAQVTACAAPGNETPPMEHSMRGDSKMAEPMDDSKMDHSKMGQEMNRSMDASSAIDPVCAARVDSKATPQVTYQGRTYYFCAETNRQMFLADPARYVRQPPGAVAPMDHSKIMDHSKMPMGGTAAAKPGAATGTKPAAPTAPMDHSKMPMGGTSAAKPGAATGAKPAAPAAPIDHSKMPMGGGAQPGKVMDPVSGLMVDPATAPKTTYQGQTYYFSSQQTRKEFLENPGKFAKKAKE